MQIEIRISEINIKTAAPDDQHNNQGLGTDLFIRKNMPGSLVGRGYTIDIFENGVKVDSVTEHNKERVLELVKKYKNFYHTNRAFQNEIQLHVTYKKRKDEEKTSMDLSQELYKRASRIQELSQGLIYPYENIKKFADDLGGGLGEPPVHQMTPTESFQAEENPSSVPTESLDSVLKKTIQKLVDYFEANRDKESSSSFDRTKKAYNDGSLYNELKSWYKSLGDVIKENNSANPDNSLDLDQFAQKVKQITLSGDPSAYQEIGVTVQPDIAQKIQEVNGKPVSSEDGDIKDDAAKGGDISNGNIEPAKSELPVAASIIKNLVKQAMDEQGLTEEDKNMIKQNPNLQTAISQSAGNSDSTLKKEVEKVTNPQATNPLQPVRASEFWRYVKTASVVGDLDKIFASWADGKFSSLEELASVWSSVYAEATGAFIKTADMAQALSRVELTPNFEQAIQALISTITQDPAAYQSAVQTFLMSKDTCYPELLNAYLTVEYPLYKTQTKMIIQIAQTPGRFKTALLNHLAARLKYLVNETPQAAKSLGTLYQDAFMPYATGFEDYARANIQAALSAFKG